MRGKILRILSSIVLPGLGFVLGLFLILGPKISGTVNPPEQRVEIATGVEPEEAPEPEPEEVEVQEEPYESPIDFEELWAQNPDVIAWISVPGTRIDYPVMQNADSDDPFDDYYLEHTIDHKSGYPGSIYIHNINSKDFDDQLTLIYGHNMSSGSMFAGLHKYESKEFMKENDKVYIYTPSATLEYRIFCAVEYTDELITDKYDINSPLDLSLYLQEIDSLSGVHLDDVEVTASDRILTMSTCIVGKGNNRLTVSAVRVDE